MTKVLIIEDDITLRDNTSDFLKEEGYEVYTADDGVKGIQVAIEIVPDIILCDISMPKMDGYEVCQTLQSVLTTNSIPFIFLTAKTQKEDLRQGMQMGADDYITKPFDYDELLKTVKIRLEKKARIVKSSEEKFYALIDNPLTGVFIYQQNKFSYINAKLSEILGFTKFELLVMSIEDLNGTENNDAAFEKFHNCLRGMQNNVHAQFRFITKEGLPVNIELYGTSIRQKGKDVIIGNMIEEKNNASSVHFKIIKSKVKLSDRELEVLRHICQGLSTSEIADKIFLSQRTIDTHRANLIAKTESTNTADLVMYAVRHGIVEL